MVPSMSYNSTNRVYQFKENMCDMLLFSEWTKNVNQLEKNVREWQENSNINVNVNIFCKASANGIALYN